MFCFHNKVNMMYYLWMQYILCEGVSYNIFYSMHFLYFLSEFFCSSVLISVFHVQGFFKCLARLGCSNVFQTGAPNCLLEAFCTCVYLVGWRAPVQESRQRNVAHCAKVTPNIRGPPTEILLLPKGIVYAWTSTFFMPGCQPSGDERGQGVGGAVRCQRLTARPQLLTPASVLPVSLAQNASGLTAVKENSSCATQMTLQPYADLQALRYWLVIKDV